MGFSLKNLVKGVYNDVNLWDNGKSHGNQYNAPPPPASTAQPKRNLASRVIDQANPWDNGRTFDQATPTNQKPLWEQSLQSVVNIPNFLNREIVSPVTTGFVNTAKLPLQAGQVAGNAVVDKFVPGTDNGATARSLDTLKNSYHSSIPGGMIDTAAKASAALSQTPISPTYNLRKGLEHEIDSQANQIDQMSNQKAQEIADGIKSGVYDPVKGQEAIKAILDNSQAVSAQRFQDMNNDINNAGFKYGDNGFDMGRKFTSNLVQTGLNVATLGAAAEASPATTALARLGETANASGKFMAAANTVGALGADKLDIKDIALAPVKGYVQGAALGLAMHPIDTGRAIGEVTTKLVDKAPIKPVLADFTEPLKINNPDNANIKQPLKINNPDNAKITGLDVRNPEGAQVKPIDIQNPEGAATGRKFKIKPLNNEGTAKVPIDPLIPEEFAGRNLPKIQKEISKQEQIYMQNHPEPLSLAKLQEKATGMSDKKYHDLLKQFNEVDAVVSGKAPISGPELPRVPSKVDNIPVSGRKATPQKQQQTPIPAPKKGVSPPIVGTDLSLGREARVPSSSKSKTPSKLQTRGFYETIFNDSNTPAKTKSALLDLDTAYQTHNMDVIQQKAANLVKSDIETATRVANAGEGDMSSMVGSELIKHYGRTGQLENEINMAQTVAENATKYGQANAALASYARMSPEGILRFTQKEIAKYNKETGKSITLPKDKAALLKQKSRDIAKMPEKTEAQRYAKEVATKDLMKEVMTTFPSTWTQKIGTLQTMAQLMNPKTMIRNVVGNSIFSGLDNLSQAVATPIDAAVSLVTGKRTTSLPSLKTQGKAGYEGLKKGYKESVGGINTGPSTQFELPDVPTFRGKVLGTAEKGLNIGLRATDRAAFEAAYNDSLRSQMKAAKVKKPTSAMEEEAVHTGLYRTFQDETISSNFFVGMKKALNKVGVGAEGKRFGLGDIVLKYPKTPGNLLARGIDYSPAGFVKAAFEATKPLVGKPFNQKAFVDTFSRAVTGSSVAFGMGYLLADNGIITTQPNADKDLRNLQKQSGLGGYQINTSGFKRWVLSGFNKDEAQLRKGDKLVSYDWAQPVSIPLSAGAALGARKKGDAALNVGENIGSSVNTLVEQPLLQGVQKAFGSKNTGGVTGAAIETAKSIPSSFTPTISSQVNQLFDNSTRNTKDANPVTESLNLVKAKIPVLAQTLPKNYTVLGDEAQRYQNGSNNAFNVFLNPSFMSNYDPNKAAQLPLDIYNNTGETKQAPRTVPNKVTINGKSKDLTGKEMSQYQEWVGTRTSAAFKALIDNPDFNRLSDVDKANKMSNIISDINAAAKVQLFGDKGYGTDNYNPKDVSKSVAAILGGETANYRPPVTKIKGAKTKKPRVAKAKKGRKSTGRKTARAKASKFNYANRLASTFTTGQKNQAALRNLISKSSTIKRQRITA